MNKFLLLECKLQNLLNLALNLSSAFFLSFDFLIYKMKIIIVATLIVFLLNINELMHVKHLELSLSPTQYYVTKLCYEDIEKSRLFVISLGEDKSYLNQQEH